MAEFTPIETQEDFDAAIQTRLQRVENKYKGYLSPEQVEEKYKDYLSPEQVNEKYKDYLTPDKAAELNNKVKEYETSSAKMRIAAEKGLPIDLADRLQGDDEESLRADADKLASYAKPQPAPQFEPEPAKETNKKDKALKDMLTKMKEG